MKKRFIVCINNATDEQRRLFTEYVGKYSWWHYMQNIWLVTDTTNTLTASIIRDKAKDIFQLETIMVFQLDSKNDTWAGFGPNNENVNMYTWINANWN